MEYVDGRLSGGSSIWTETIGLIAGLC